MEPKLHISGRLLEKEKKVEVGVVQSHSGLLKLITVVYFFETDREDPLVRYKDLRLIHLDIIGTDKYSALLQSLEQLAQVPGKRGCCGFHEYFSGEGADCILSLLLQSRLPRT